MPRTSSLFAVAASALSAAPLPPQGLTWLPVPTALAPAARSGHALAAHATAGNLVMFGGAATGQLFGDTWLGNGAVWVQATPSIAPPARTGHAMAYDSARHLLVLFGGSGAGGLLGDTWEWDGAAWGQITPVLVPAARTGHAMAYDSVRQRVVLFGGNGAGGQLGDTWEWHGLYWTQAAPASSPIARDRHAMAFDATGARVVLFGGSNSSLGRLADTWTFDGGTWLPLFTAVVPTPRVGHAMAFDEARSRIVMVGGDDGALLADTWELAGGEWSSAVPGTFAGRRDHALAYDPVRDAMLLFGGAASSLQADTWSGLVLADVYGAGCGTPPLGLLPDAGRPPVLGGNPGATIVQAPSPLAAVAIGFSRQFFGPFPLPLTLTGLGMTGCDLLQSAELLGFGATPSSPSMLDVQLALPFDLSLVGHHLYLQAYAFAPGVNPLQIVVSNGLDWVLQSPPGWQSVIREDFLDDSMLDRDASAGQWGGGDAAFARIGGDARHGDFELSLCTPTGEVVDGRAVYELDCTDLTIPAANTTTATPIPVTDGRFFFGTFVLPANVHLRLVGDGSAPAVITVAGRLDVQGVVEANGGALATLPNPSLTVIGQTGAPGGLWGGKGGDGGRKSNSTKSSTGQPTTPVPPLSQYSGQDGEGVRVRAGHAYAASSFATGGRGSAVFPASANAGDQLFGVNPPPTSVLYYATSSTAGGGGGGLFAAGVDGRVEAINHPNPQQFMGPMAAGGAALPLFPWPAVGGSLVASSDHFLVGGAGGGGSGSNSTLSLSLSRAFAPGAGGGGGGGAFALRAGDRLRVAPLGKLLAAGGSAADNGPATGSGPQVAPGGGGSGGSIVLQSGNTADIAGLVDVRGGLGGFFSRRSTSSSAPLGADVQIRGGNGSAGFVRLETSIAPPLTALATMVPAVTGANVGALTEVDALVSCRSRWYATGLVTAVGYVRYEIEATVHGLPVLYSDDPGVPDPAGIYAGPATTGAALRTYWQAADIDPVTGQPGSIAPWRTRVALGSSPSLATDGRNGFRFLLVADRTLAADVTVQRVSVVYQR